MSNMMPIAKKTISLFCIPFLFFSTKSIYAQSETWTLEKCILHAYEHNLDLKLARLNIDSEKQNIILAKANFLPSLSASIVNSHSFNTIRNSDNRRELEHTRSSSLKLGTNITLFNGFQNKMALKKSYINSEIKELNYQESQNNLFISITNAYLSILLNKELIKVSESQLEISKDQLKRTSKRVDAGFVPKGNLLEAESTIAIEEQQLVDRKNSYELAKLDLAQFLEIDDYKNFYVEDITMELPSLDILNRDPIEIYELALNTFPEIQSADKQREIAKYDMKIAKAGYYPSLSADYSLSSSYSNSDKENLLKSLDFNKSHGGGLTLSIPIFNNMRTKVNVVKAEIHSEITDIQFLEKKENLKRKIIDIHTKAFGDYKKYESSQKTLLTAQNSFEFAEKRYQAGIISIYDLNSTKNNVVRALSDLVRSKYNLLFSLKILNFYAGVEIRP